MQPIKLVEEYYRKVDSIQKEVSAIAVPIFTVYAHIFALKQSNTVPILGEGS